MQNNDLISRSAVKNIAAKYGAAEDFDSLVDEIPAVDAEQVVRCKDCEEYIPWLDGDYICGRIGSYFGDTKPNDFCSQGRRKK